MADQLSQTAFSAPSVTLNSLKAELGSLNMRMLLAMQTHDETAQSELKEQLASIQHEIQRMSAGKWM